MKIRTVVLLIATHCAVGVLGFGIGIYALPILTAPSAPSEAAIKVVSSEARYTTQFRRDLKDSDALHWGEGTVSVGPKYTLPLWVGWRPVRITNSIFLRNSLRPKQTSIV